MSDSQKLVKILKEKELCVKEVALDAGLPPTTVYSIIQRDGNIRFDIALRLARVLDVYVGEICSDDIVNLIRYEIIR